MITEIREKTVVRHGGKIEISSPELIEGTEVEVVALVESEMDETEYLLSTQANREILLKSIREAEEHPERLIVYNDIDELEKDFLS